MGVLDGLPEFSEQINLNVQNILYLRQLRGFSMLKLPVQSISKDINMRHRINPDFLLLGIGDFNQPISYLLYFLEFIFRYYDDQVNSLAYLFYLLFFFGRKFFFNKPPDTLRGQNSNGPYEGIFF